MLPTIFVSHGAPSLVLEDGPTQEFFRHLGATMERPRAIVCVTAHWDTPQLTVGLAAAPAMIYDFHGFPQALYELKYPAPGDPALAASIAQTLGATGDPKRGFDHGVWSPLMLLFPDANIPVIPISVQPRISARDHFAVGQALRPFREQGVLIIGSGSATHNLAELGRRPLPPHAQEFENWLCESIIEGRTEELLEWNTRSPHPYQNHPTPEHFLPLFAPLGAASKPEGRILHRGFEFGSLSMDAFGWD